MLTRLVQDMEYFGSGKCWLSHHFGKAAKAPRAHLSTWEMYSSSSFLQVRTQNWKNLKMVENGGKEKNDVILEQIHLHWARMECTYLPHTSLYTCGQLGNYSILKGFKINMKSLKLYDHGWDNYMSWISQDGPVVLWPSLIINKTSFVPSITAWILYNIVFIVLGSLKSSKPPSVSQ